MRDKCQNFLRIPIKKTYIASINFILSDGNIRSGSCNEFEREKMGLYQSESTLYKYNILDALGTSTSQ
jgi:hypothetical protein